MLCDVIPRRLAPPPPWGKVVPIFGVHLPCQTDWWAGRRRRRSPGGPLGAVGGAHTNSGQSYDLSEDCPVPRRT